MNEMEVYELAREYSEKAAKVYGCNPDDMAAMLTGIAKVESNFNPDAKNKSSSARGMMQVLICTQREIEYKRLKIEPAIASRYCKNYPKAPVNDKVKDKMYDPDYSMLLASYELGYQYKRYANKYPSNTWQIAVHAYNQGSYPGTRKLDGQNYSNKVLNYVSKIDKDVSANINNIFNSNRQEFY